MNLIQSALQTMKNLSLVFVNVKGPSYLFKKRRRKIVTFKLWGTLDILMSQTIFH